MFKFLDRKSSLIFWSAFSLMLSFALFGLFSWGAINASYYSGSYEPVGSVNDAISMVLAGVSFVFFVFTLFKTFKMNGIMGTGVLFCMVICDIIFYSIFLK